METMDICPHCSAPMGERLLNDHYYTCASCHEVFIHDSVSPTSRETIFKELEMASPIATGSRGKAGDKAFTVIGCTSLFLERSMLNIYSLQWNGGLQGFLIENDGDFFIVDGMVESKPGSFKKVNPGKESEILSFGKAYCCSMDKISYISLSGTGKLAFSKYTGSVCCGFYKNTHEGAYAFISKDDVSFLSGKFYEFQDLNFSPIKAVHEWYK
jgi:hypothetical protein